MQLSPDAARKPLVPTYPQPGTPSRGRAEQIVDSILETAHRLRSVLAGHFAKLGLNDVRYGVLKCVGRSTPGGCSQAELAAQLQLSESNVSGLVERMRIDGYVYRLRSKRDRRKRVLLLTEQGQQTLSRVDACRQATVGVLFHRLDPFQQRLLAELLAIVVDELREDSGTRRRSPAKSSEFDTGFPNPLFARPEPRALKDMGE